jgi:hypothetical protein
MRQEKEAIASVVGRSTRIPVAAREFRRTVGQSEGLSTTGIVSSHSLKPETPETYLITFTVLVTLQTSRAASRTIMLFLTLEKNGSAHRRTNCRVDRRDTDVRRIDLRQQEPFSSLAKASPCRQCQMLVDGDDDGAG